MDLVISDEENLSLYSKNNQDGLNSRAMSPNPNEKFLNTQELLFSGDKRNGTNSSDYTPIKSDREVAVIDASVAVSRDLTEGRLSPNMLVTVTGGDTTMGGMSERDAKINK